ncbi:MAG: hypothetical protein HHJ12_11875 [Glaciimonas sp.]|nr:hypothetical protein [Glaciimonas sp.]
MVGVFLPEDPGAQGWLEGGSKTGKITAWLHLSPKFRKSLIFCRSDFSRDQAQTITAKAAPGKSYLIAKPAE